MSTVVRGSLGPWPPVRRAHGIVPPMGSTSPLGVCVCVFAGTQLRKFHANDRSQVKGASPVFKTSILITDSGPWRPPIAVARLAIWATPFRAALSDALRRPQARCRAKVLGDCLPDDVAAVASISAHSPRAECRNLMYLHAQVPSLNEPLSCDARVAASALRTCQREPRAALHPSHAVHQRARALGA